MTGVMMVASGWETCPSGSEKVRGGMFREEFSIRLPIPGFLVSPFNLGGETLFEGVPESRRKTRASFQTKAR